MMPYRLSVGFEQEPVTHGLTCQLGSIVGQPVVIGVHLGPPRANRKPVVQVMSFTGRTLAFAKLGTNHLTRTLVRAETSALRWLAGASLTKVDVPNIIYSGRTGEQDLLVLGPVDTRRKPTWLSPAIEGAMLEVSEVAGVTRAHLTRSGFWRALRGRVAGLRGEMGGYLRSSLCELERAHASPPICFASWHGDWTPWNMSTAGGRIVVWDWERFSTNVPSGFDAIHFELQSAIRMPRVEPRDAVCAISERAPELLRPFGVATDEAPWVVAAYLLEIGTRYLSDGQQSAGGRLGDLGTWLTPELSRLVGRLGSGRLP